MAGYNVLGYIEALQGRTFPPLLVEVVLKSGQTYYVKNAFRPDPEFDMVGLRIWDLRAADIASLPEKLNATAGKDWSQFAEIDSALDQANLWVRAADIEGFIEWHERYWPVTDTDQASRPIGFFQPGDDSPHSQPLRPKEPSDVTGPRSTGGTSSSRSSDLARPMRVNFRIGDVFPHDDVLSQFVSGLCIVVNDITLTVRHMEAHGSWSRETPGDQPGVNLSYLYRLCAVYREAASFLGLSLKKPEVDSFLSDLSPEGCKQLEVVKESFTPPEGSFVEGKVRRVRNAASHYRDMSPGKMRPYLEGASDERSWIEVGEEGTSIWYEFAAAVFKETLLKEVGQSEAELEDFMNRLAKLVLAFASFAREAVTMWLRSVDQDALEVTE